MHPPGFDSDPPGAAGGDPAVLEVRPCRSRACLGPVVEYFHSASDASLAAMGAARALLPAREEWLERLEHELARDERTQQLCYLIWLCDGRAIGHSSMNKIRYGEEGYVHLHLWTPAERGRGLGRWLMRASIAYYIERFRLARVIAEPYALNPAPNAVFAALGFRLEKSYRTTPGAINTEQDVNRWQFTVDRAGR